MQPKVKITLLVETEIEFVDAGYLGDQASIEEHLKKAQNDIQNCSLLVKQGSRDPKVVPFRHKIQAITIIPSET